MAVGAGTACGVRGVVSGSPGGVLVLLLAVLLSGPACADRLSFAAIGSVPPYVIAFSDSGVVMDIVRETLALTGHELGDIHYMANLRAQRALAEGRVDMAMHVPATEPGVFHSLPLVHYWNVAITLQDRGHRIRALADLAGKRIVAFQNAGDLLGEDFREAVRHAASYREQPKQRGQVVALFRGGADVLVMDLHIFRYFRQILQNEDQALDLRRPVRVHSILPPSPRTIAFRDPRLRDAFNIALKQIQENGTYAEILEQYYFRSR